MLDFSPFQLSAQQKRVVIALLEEASVRDAARSAGVSEQTIYRWLHLPNFAEAKEAAERAQLAMATGQLLARSALAARTLEELLGDDNPPAVRLRAAQVILDYAVRAVEAKELERRLRELETMLETVNARG